MHRFKSFVGGLLLVGLAAGSVGLAQAQSAAADAITTRQAGMKQAGENAGAIKKALDAGGDLAAVAPNAQVLVDWGHKIPTLFVPGSGAEAGVKTRALPEIWTNRAEFEKDAANLATQATALVTALKANDKTAAAAAFAATGGACGTCHRSFQAKL